MKPEEVLTEAVEVCPFCERENVFVNWDVEKRGYIAKCWQCGRKIMLCDECLHADDNKGGFCDWREIVRDGKCVEGHCFRGVIKRKNKEGSTNERGNRKGR